MRHKTIKQNKRNKKTLCKKIIGGNLAKTVGMFIVGLGCSMDSYDEFNTIMQNNYHYDEFKTYCDSSFIRTIKNIGHAICLKSIPKTNSFVKEIFNILIEKLSKPNTYIYIVGHSYGGAVVATVALLLQDYINAITDEDEKNIFINKLNTYLIIYTVGTIYMPNKKQLPDVNLYNYLYKNDISEECLAKYNNNNINNPLLQNSYVKYINSSENMKTRRWKIHNNYYPIIQSIFRWASDKKPFFRQIGSRHLAIGPITPGITAG